MLARKRMGWGILTVALAAVMMMGTTTFAQEKSATQAKPEGKAEVQVFKPTLPNKANLPAYLQEISVTIRSDRSEGSGTLIVRGKDAYVFTAGHVVDDLRDVREVIDPVKGGKRYVIEFRNAKIISILREDGEAVGRLEMDAEIVSYSDSENGEDLALLRLRKKNYATKSAVFYRSTDKEKFPPVGSELYHCGSLLGEFGSNSLIDGMISQIGRVHQKKLYDQTNVNAFPGSSGGGVYKKETGEYCGMIVRGTYGGFNLMVPQRRIDSWAKRMKLEWVFDASLPVPSEEELKKLSIEDTGFPPVAPSAPSADKKGNGHHSIATREAVGFLIRPLNSSQLRTKDGPSSTSGTMIRRIFGTDK